MGRHGCAGIGLGKCDHAGACRLRTLTVREEPGHTTGRLEYALMIVSHSFDHNLMLPLQHLTSQDQGQVLEIGLAARQAGGPLGFGGTGVVEKRVRGVGIEATKDRSPAAWRSVTSAHAGSGWRHMDWDHPGRIYSDQIRGSA